MFTQKAVIKASAKIGNLADGNLSIDSARDIMLNAYDGQDGNFGEFIDAVKKDAGIKLISSGYIKS